MSFPDPAQDTRCDQRLTYDDWTLHEFAPDSHSQVLDRPEDKTTLVPGNAGCETTPWNLDLMILDRASVDQTMNDIAAEWSARELQEAEVDPTMALDVEEAVWPPYNPVSDQTSMFENMSSDQMLSKPSCPSRYLPMRPSVHLAADKQNKMPGAEETSATAAEDALAHHSTIRNQCERCRRHFTHPKSLKRHLRTVHSGSRFSCAHCQEVFKRRDIKERHEAEQHSDDAGTVECRTCGDHVRERALKEHMKSQKCLANGTRAKIATTAMRRCTESLQTVLSITASFATATHLWILAETEGGFAPGLRPNIETLNMLRVKQRLFEVIRMSLIDPAKIRSPEVLGAVALAWVYERFWNDIKSPHKAPIYRLWRFHSNPHLLITNLADQFGIWVSSSKHKTTWRQLFETSCTERLYSYLLRR